MNGYVMPPVFHGSQMVKGAFVSLYGDTFFHGLLSLKGLSVGENKKAPAWRSPGLYASNCSFRLGQMNPAPLLKEEIEETKSKIVPGVHCGTKVGYSF